MKNLFLFVALAMCANTALPQAISASVKNTNSWTIVNSYTIPGKASGLAWDGEYLYSGLYSAPGDDNKIYKINPSDGNYSLQCSGPFESAYGLTYDNSSGNLWTTDHPGAFDPGIAIQFDMDGEYISEFDLPSTYFSGIAYDNGDFWTICYYDPDGEVFFLADDGTVIDQFATPGDQPWDICKEGNDLWIADYNADMLYKIDSEGNLLESHDSENAKPAGIVFDGTYLWYVDGGLQVESTLYKVDLGGTGNPDINVPVTFYDYGMVTEETTDTWQCLIYNEGDITLEITFGEISGDLSEDIDWPEGTSFTIDANSNLVISIDYIPTQTGELDAYAILETNDPVTTEVELHMIGTAVYSGPHIHLEKINNNFGKVRNDAHTRWLMVIENQGDATLEISEIVSTNPDRFYISDRDTIPFNLEPLEKKTLGIWFTPDSEETYNATVGISNNTVGQSPLEIEVTGEGFEKQWLMGDPLWDFEIMNPFDDSPKAIIGIQDVTGDGIEDVVTASEDNYIRCFNGNSHNKADLIWELEIYSGNVYGQNAINRIKDINNDGYEDIIVGTAGGDRSVIAISGYTGKQIWKHQTNEYGDGGWVYQVDSKFSYNDDDFPDVLAATGDDNSDTGPKRVYCLNGRTGETIWETPLNGPVFSVIGIEDFTQDGKPDVIAGASNESESEGYVYGIDGSDGVNKWKFVTQSTSVWALAQLDDVDDSGFKDFMLGDFGGSYYIVDPYSLYIIRYSDIGSNLILRFVVLDDINGDGFVDVLVAHSGQNAIVLDGAGGGELMNTPLEDKSWCVAKIGDISGDNINDVVVGTLFSNNYAYMINPTHSDIMFDDNYGEPVDAINSINDINGDGSMEMVVGGRNGKIVCYSGGLDAAVDIAKNDSPVLEMIEHKAFPNPFSDEVSISINLPEADQISIQIFDQNGKLIKDMANQSLAEGIHQFKWDANSHLKNGFYYYNISTSKTVLIGKLVLLR